MLCFASMDAATKYIVHDYGVAQILFVRSVIFLALAAAFAHRRGGLRRALAARRPWLQIVRAALAVAENASFVLAFRYLPLAETHAIAASSPLIVVVLAAPMLGERVGLDRWLAVVVGFAGVLLIIRPGFAALNPALLIPLAGALLWALYQILLRLCGRTDTSETTVLYSAAVSLVLTSVVGLPGWTPPDGFGWGMLLAIGLLGCFGHITLTFALAAAEAASIQPYSYTLLLWVSVLGVVVFGNIPTPWTIVGGTIVVLSGLFAWYRERHGMR
jgi:drug/metabolite transporter (DMT)-like permease